MNTEYYFILQKLIIGSLYKFIQYNFFIRLHRELSILSSLASFHCDSTISIMFIIGFRTEEQFPLLLKWGIIGVGVRLDIVVLMLNGVEK